MAFAKLWVIAYRDLGRNRRRTLFTLIAVALGVGLLILLEGYIAGVWDGALQNAIRLQTGHVQVRNPEYEEQKVSLLWADLLENAGDTAPRAADLPEVKAAAPVLWATAILNTVNDSAGLKLYGIDPASALYDPIREAMTAGEFLSAGDRSGILLGKRLADELGIGVGQNVSLTVVDADGQASEATFVVSGLYVSGVPSYDQNSAFMPLDKAQAFTGVGDRASAVVMLLHRQEDADRVAAALAGPNTTAETWQQMNQLLLETVETTALLYNLLNLIVMLVVAVVIANTLLMAVFERIREMGILAALGMKGRQIMLMYLLEATILGLIGIAIGAALGSAGVGYLATKGIYIGDIASTVDSIAVGSTLYGRFVPGKFAWLSLWTLIVILLASLYPAWFAARLEPVDALRAQ